MQDVKKVDIEKRNNQKRDRRRRKNMLGYYILVAVLTVIIFAVLSVTLMFNVREVVISGLGASSYKEEDIIRSSGIVKGDNLVRMNTDKIREAMLADLTFIDDVEIKKNYPNGIQISITPSVGTAYVECQGGYMLVSRSWRIIGHTEQPEDKSIIVVNGFDCESNEEKTVMASKDPDKDEALRSILHEIESQDMKNMVSVDISDKYDVVLNYDNRIKIKIEKPNDIEYKLRYAYKIITDELRENKNGYLIYRNSLGYSYVSEEEYNRINGGISALLPDKNEEQPLSTDVSAVTEPVGSDVSASGTNDTALPPVTQEIQTQHEGW